MAKRKPTVFWLCYAMGCVAVLASMICLYLGARPGGSAGYFVFVGLFWVVAIGLIIQAEVTNPSGWWGSIKIDS